MLCFLHLWRVWLSEPPFFLQALSCCKFCIYWVHSKFTLWQICTIFNVYFVKQPNKVYISEFTCVYDYKTNKNPLKRHGNNMSWNISNAIFKMWMFTKLQLDNSNNQPNLNMSDGVINKIQSSNSGHVFLHIESWIENTLI